MRHTTDLHPPLLHLSKSQKSVYFSGIKIFNYLPQYVKELTDDVTKFRYALTNFLLVHSIHLRSFLPGIQCLILVTLRISRLFKYLYKLALHFVIFHTESIFNVKILFQCSVGVMIMFVYFKLNLFF
jgi:hypothetical protein